MIDFFSQVALACDFYPYQQQALAAILAGFGQGKSTGLLLAPPGSGKTLMGWACIFELRCKTLILSPNTTLQWQWVQQWQRYGVSFSELVAVEDDVGTALAAEPLILSSTYQLLSSAYRRNDEQQLQAFAAYDLVILDECHHVRRQWGEAILALETRRLQHGKTTRRLGLTATPPQEASVKEQQQLQRLLGSVDYAISLPAMIRSGYLAPFQDLVYLVRPSLQESQYIHSAHSLLHRLQTQWAEAQPSLALFAEQWLLQWQYQAEKDPDLYLACLRYLHHAGLWISDIGWHPEQEEPLTMDDRAYLLGAYALAEVGESHADFVQLCHVLQMLGYRYRQQRFWPVEGQVEKVLGTSQAKLQALSDILRVEYAAQHEDLRGLILADFALTHAPGQRTALQGLADPDAGGALGLFRYVCLHHAELRPFLMTGRYVLCSEALQTVMGEHLQQALPHVQLRVTAYDGFCAFEASPTWSAKDYVACLTDFLAQGHSLCLVGTRGLLGEGWDCPALNTLVDFTRTTRFVSVNQIRGRSLRKDPRQPFKVANQWDIVAVLPELESGLKDLERWQRKHQHYYGLCDDGLIEKGVGHVHASFTRRDPHEIMASLEDLNQTFLARAQHRQATYDQWGIGKPYQDHVQETLQISVIKARRRSSAPQKVSLTFLPADLQQRNDFVLQQMQRDMHILDSVQTFLHLGLWTAAFVMAHGGVWGMASVVAAGLSWKTRAWQKRQYLAWRQGRYVLPRRALLEALGRALWEACIELQQPGLSEEERQLQWAGDDWHMLTREDGTLRFMSSASPERHGQWRVAFQELLAPLQGQRYWLSFVLRDLVTGRTETHYLAVPFLFGRSRTRAQILQEHLGRVLGSCELHYMRQATGKALADQHQGRQALHVQLQQVSLWF